MQTEDMSTEPYTISWVKFSAISWTHDRKGFFYSRYPAPAYSPLINLLDPSTITLTVDHDDRVVPLHSLKLSVTMQHVLCTSLEKSPQTNPIIGRIESKAGHGAGMPTQKVIDEAADTWRNWWTHPGSTRQRLLIFFGRGRKSYLEF